MLHLGTPYISEGHLICFKENWNKRKMSGLGCASLNAPHLACGPVNLLNGHLIKIVEGNENLHFV